ncbi:MAG TPA: LON peptidase substrate-binding domain-containing protein, partial [Desulfosarcina sp.]|nr:LON peptidase substrate-binding domain-containing protein [Desulfosarcina sp.]
MTEKPTAIPQPPGRLPEVLPILPLFDAVLFPKMVLPLVVMQGESVKVVDEAMAKDRLIGLVVSKDRDQKAGTAKEHLSAVGTSALILKMAKTQDDRTQLLVQGLSRFRILGFSEKKEFIQARVGPVSEVMRQDKETEALTANIVSQFSRIVELSPGLPPEIAQMARSIQEPGTLADMVASTINASLEEKQGILEMQDIKQRLTAVTRLVNHQAEILELGSKIQNQVKGDMD